MQAVKRREPSDKVVWAVMLALILIEGGPFLIFCAVLIGCAIWGGQ